MVVIYILLIVFGLPIGSFLNVLIYRIPLGEEFVKTPSHCPNCGKQLKPLELIPVFSWLIQRGRCKGCGAPISKQYPIIEATNALLWVLCAFANSYFNGGFVAPDLPLQCLMLTALLTLSVIDARTREIPFGINVFIFALGIALLVLEFIFFRPDAFRNQAITQAIGFVAVSVPLLLIERISGGRAIGGGDVKLMAAAGLFLGWKLILLALIIGCIAGSIIHIVRMKIAGANRYLALGPYLAGGIAVSMLCGNWIIYQYLSLFSA
ncbi:MAG: prepilin peptidase [Oscillospiraceae bacterium]|nr:prepilin peptidase [Oscillospiraceae bacterium]